MGRLRKHGWLLAALAVVALGIFGGMAAVLRGRTPAITSREPRPAAELQEISRVASATWRSALWRNSGRRDLRNGNLTGALKTLLRCPPFAKNVTFAVHNEPAPPSLRGFAEDFVTVVGRNQSGDSCVLLLGRTPDGWRPSDSFTGR